MQLVKNRSTRRNEPLNEAQSRIVGAHAPEDVRGYLPAFPIYRETPLVALPALAKELGVGAIAIKDEGPRYGLGSFKALGGAYAVRASCASMSRPRWAAKSKPPNCSGKPAGRGRAT